MSLTESALQIFDLLYASQGGPFLLPGTDRVRLARLFAQLGYTTGAEIGVEHGVYAETLCKSIPGLKYYGVDFYQDYPGYTDFLGDFEQEARERLSPYDVTIIRKTSSDATRDFADGALDFVYIDSNHLTPWIDNDIYWWAKKVRAGGIVSGHDYVDLHKEVMRAVDHFVRVNQIRPLFVVGDPKETSQADRICSWFFVKGDEELER